MNENQEEIQAPTASVVQGNAAREAALKTQLMQSLRGLPQDVIVMNIAYDIVTNKCHIVGSTCPEQVAKVVRDLAHRCIEDWYEQNRKN